MQCRLLLLLIAICACTVRCSQPDIRRVPRDAECTGHYIAVLRKDTSHERLLEIVDLLRNFTDGCKVHGYMETAIKAIVLGLSYDALQEVSNLPEVVYIEEEGISYATSLENGDFGSGAEDLWYLDRLDQLPDEIEGVDVYILDTGIRFEHHEFGLRAKYSGYDPVDQYEFEEGTLDYVPLRGADCNGHGTAVASLVGGKTYGKSRKANLYSVRVLRCDTTAPWRVVLDGLNFVAEIIPKRGQNAIVLLPLSGTLATSINEAIQGLYEKNVIVITAAGNDGVDACLKTPASSQHAITVASTDRYDNVAVTSNYGSCVDLFAPGEDILAASSECDKCTAVRSGTTLSAAITAGVVAVYFSQFPHFTPDLMKERLLYQSIPDIIDLTPVPDDMKPQTPNRLLNRGCGGVVTAYVTETGVLESPGFPDNYPSNMWCRWTLVAELDCDIVKVNFTHIILEEKYDKLTVCPKNVCSEGEKIVLTGDYNTPDCVLESEGQNMTIEMRTDGFTDGPGFRATFFALFGISNRVLPKQSCSRQPSSVNSTVQLDLFSAGDHVGDRFSIKMGWNEVLSGRMRGVNLVVLDEGNGSVIMKQNFNTYTGSMSNNLATAIDRLPQGRIVCVAVGYDGVNQMNDDTKRALMLLGSAKIYQLAKYGSWALIGYKGAPRGRAVEQVCSPTTIPAHVAGRVHLTPFHPQFVEITAESAGDYNAGKYATITVNGTVIDIPYSGYDRGLHVVVVNDETGLIMHKKIFDTAAESGVSSASDQFVELIECLPTGTVVAIAIKEQGTSHLSEKAKLACESIGSEMIRQILSGGSWAIVGRKGAAKGSVPETRRYNSYYYYPSKAYYSFAPFLASDAACFVVIQSTNQNGAGNFITVGGTTIKHETTSTHGNLVAFLRDGECSVERNMSFTSSTDLFNFVKSVPPGRTVLVNLAYQYRGLSDAGRAALEVIGSAYVGSVAYPYTFGIIGRKGNARGSAIEGSFNYAWKSLGGKIPLYKANGDFLSVHSGGTELGNYGKIENSTQLVFIPPEYTQGLIMSVFEGSVADQVYLFNMTASNSSLDIELFINVTDSLPVGTVVALATNDAAALKQSEEVREAIEGLGSSYISFATKGGSWALVGGKGVKQGSVLEAASNDGPVEIVTHTLPVTPVENNTTCRIFVESAGSGSIGGLWLTVNTKTTTLPAEEGIRLVVMKQDSCEVENITTYPTHTGITHLHALAESIEALPSGRIVVASIYGTAHPSSLSSSTYFVKARERAKAAFESIGSALFRGVGYREAWAIIGWKGAVPGTVPESFARSLSNPQSSAVTVGGVMKLRLSCEKELYQLECLSNM